MTANCTSIGVTEPTTVTTETISITDATTVAPEALLGNVDISF